jgi:hypothetical protein
MNLKQRIRAIKSLQTNIDKDQSKIEQREIAIGQHIKAIKAEFPKRWTVIVKDACGIKRSRAYEYLQMAGGRPVEAVRHATTERSKKKRKNNARPLRNGQPLESQDNSPPAGPPKLALVKDADADATRSDKDRDEPLNAYVILASNAREFCARASNCLPGIMDQTRPCAEDWATMVAMTRMVADEWARLLKTVEAMPAPATRRTKRILVA